uniref:Sushi domain-containing protein n=1 Tax=Moschus moschiferus TaxID=68415 RepID=A0A8C6CZS9_MOSMO
IKTLFLLFLFQGKPCNYPVIKHGWLYDSNKGYFPARVNQQFVYYCDPYFVPPSQRTWDHLTCTEEGWSPEEPCLRECIFNNLENGHTPRLEKKVLQDETVRVRCYHGYSLQNNQNTMTCTENGWSPPPRCIRVSEKNFGCSQPPQIDHGTIKSSSSAEERREILEQRLHAHGTKLSYTCEKGFKISENDVIICHMGKWSSPPQYCISIILFLLFYSDVSCVNPPQVENAIIQNQKSRYQSGEKARYECIGNYDLFGEIDVVCLNGTWTKPPQCKDSQGKCGPPPPIDNGDITSLQQSVYHPGMTVEYQCQAYYELRGNRKVVCQNGEWSEPPKCLEACVISEETMKKHRIQLRWKHDKKFYSRTEDNIEFMCQHGYRRVTPHHTFRTTCQEGKVVYPRCE